ncbi:hypothetical protein GCM10009764_54390 [Nocardia ninae]
MQLRGPAAAARQQHEQHHQSDGLQYGNRRKYELDQHGIRRRVVVEESESTIADRGGCRLVARDTGGG